MLHAKLFGKCAPLLSCCCPVKNEGCSLFPKTALELELTMRHFGCMLRVFSCTGAVFYSQNVPNIVPRSSLCFPEVTKSNSPFRAVVILINIVVVGGRTQDNQQKIPIQPSISPKTAQHKSKTAHQFL